MDSNAREDVLLHSRRSFTNINCEIEANLESWVWAIESMVSLRYNKIIFGADAKDLVGTVIRPPAWPSYGFHSFLILKWLNRLPSWKIQGEDRRVNIGQMKIVCNHTSPWVSPDGLKIFWSWITVLSLYNAY